MLLKCSNGFTYTKMGRIYQIMQFLQKHLMKTTKTRYIELENTKFGRPINQLKAMHNPYGKLSIIPVYLRQYPTHDSISSILLSLVDMSQPT